MCITVDHLTEKRRTVFGPVSQFPINFHVVPLAMMCMMNFFKLIQTFEVVSDLLKSHYQN